MPSNPSPAATATLQDVLHRLYPRARTEVKTAAGGFVAGVVGPEFAASRASSDEMQRLFETLVAENQRIPRFEDRVAVFSLYFKPDERAFFEEEAHLRTRRTEVNGLQMTGYSSMGDASLLAHALDAEALLLDPASSKSCRVIADPRWHFPPRFESIKYVQFDLGGHFFGVDRVELGQDEQFVVWID